MLQLVCGKSLKSLFLLSKKCVDKYKCLIYLQFQIEGKSPVQICGRTGDQESFRPSVLDGVGPRSFIVPPGKSVTVSFYYRDELIDKSAMLSKQVPIYDWGYLFRASIAFTAHKCALPHNSAYQLHTHKYLNAIN